MKIKNKPIEINKRSRTKHKDQGRKDQDQERIHKGQRSRTKSIKIKERLRKDQIKNEFIKINGKTIRFKRTKR